MITKQLNVGDYIFTAQGDLARITKINKQTYSFALLTRGYLETRNISFNGIKHNYPYDDIEFFECTEPQAKALEAAFRSYKLSTKVEEILEENKKLLGSAKYFLNQLEGIEEVEDE